mmetsp:Transcript_10246/g.35665  ORF Transcript_10246/g.35665 Transcript_10246/m.35665 type:complete len:240 (+) Transcript_10246:291-1010(+)
MFKRIFGSSKPASSSSSSAPGPAVAPKKSSTVETIEKLKTTLSMLEKREALLQKKVDEAHAQAKEMTRQGKKPAALLALKKKKLYEGQLSNLGDQQLRIHDQITMLETAKLTSETVGALQSSAAEMKRISKETNVDRVDKTMDELNEHTENLRQVQDALGQPVGPSAEFDEDELESELAELAELEDETEALATGEAMPAPPTTVRPVPAQPVPAAPAARDEAEDELAALQKEMGLLEAA